MLLAIPLLPFVGFLINAGLGRRLTKSASGAVACGAVLASFAVSVAAVLRLVALDPESRTIVQTVFEWVHSGSFNAPFRLSLDPLSAVMILVVTGVGSLIHIYSTAYMHDERGGEFARYFSYLNLFTAFMLVLVLGANFLVLFVGWEGVGLCSYLLIGFWYQKKSASDAGKKAFIVNRIGDFAFVLGVFAVFTQFGTIDFQEVARAAGALRPETSFGVLSLMTLLLFAGATGKSAQIPLYVWLPDAMEGPTPVSALIHAATMVTAGVYLIGRNAVLFGHAPQTLAMIGGIGAATAFLAGTVGLVQHDIKRVLAYSTVSQLGYMFLAMGVGAYTAGIFHLFTHAFFKALLFLGSGAVIHALSGEQDLRKMGGLKSQLPVTYWTFLIGALAIAGVPGLAGFFSKDEILFRAYASGHLVLYALGLATALLTAIYMFRLVFLAFHGPPADAAGSLGHAPAHAAAQADSAVHGTSHLHDAPPAMAIALVVLAVGSVVTGYVGLPSVLGGSNRLERFLEPSFSPLGRSEVSSGETPAEDRVAPGVELALMATSSAVAIGGIGIAALLFLGKRRNADPLAARFAGLQRLLLNKYYVDEVYDAALVQPIHLVSEDVLWKGLDARGIDGAVNGVGAFVRGGADLLRRVQTGSVRVYAASLLLGVVLVVGYFAWR